MSGNMKRKNLWDKYVHHQKLKNKINWAQQRMRTQEGNKAPGLNLFPPWVAPHNNKTWAQDNWQHVKVDYVIGMKFYCRSLNELFHCPPFNKCQRYRPTELRLRGPLWRSGVQTTANSEHDNRKNKLHLDPRKTCKGLVENCYCTRKKMSETSSQSHLFLLATCHCEEACYSVYVCVLY